MRVSPTVVLAACRTLGPLPDTPIVGGTESQRTLVTDELLEFDTFVGSGRVRVSEIVFTDLPAGDSGQYSRWTRRIELEGELEDLDVRSMLRHELCHALDDRERIYEEQHVHLDTLADGLLAESVTHETGRRDRRAEVFAIFCALGALPMRALETTCEGEPSEVAELAEVVSLGVWRESPFKSSLSWDPSNFVTWQDAYDVAELFAAATRDPANGVNLFLTHAAPDPYESVVVDLETGLELLSVNAPNLVEYVPAARDWPPGIPGDLSTGEAYGWADGPAVNLSYVNLDVSWSSVNRLFLYDESDGRWRVADPACVQSNAGHTVAIFNTDSDQSPATHTMRIVMTTPSRPLPSAEHTAGIRDPRGYIRPPCPHPRSVLPISASASSSPPRCRSSRQSGKPHGKGSSASICRP